MSLLMEMVLFTVGFFYWSLDSLAKVVHRCYMCFTPYLTLLTMLRIHVYTMLTLYLVNYDLCSIYVTHLTVAMVI